MTYTKTDWNNEASPPISAENLDKIEQGIFDAHLLLSSSVTPEMFGAVGDGVTDDYAALTSWGASGFPLKGDGEYRTSGTVYVSNDVNMSGYLIADITANATYTLRANGVDDIKIKANIKGYDSSSKWSGIGVENCSGAIVKDCVIEIDQGRGIAVTNSPKSVVAGNTITLGMNGNQGIGIQYHGADNEQSVIENNDIKPFLRVSDRTTIGVQPTGEQWGAAGIVLYNGNDLDAAGDARYNWESVNGTYTITGSESVPISIPLTELVDGDEWEAGASNSLSQTTGEYNTHYPLYSVPVDGAIEITGKTGTTLNRIGVTGEVLTYQALSYKHGCRHITIKGNTVDGVIYGGISVFGARDITVSNNDISSCGDIGYDPEGSVRTYLSGGTIKDCNFGALLVGHGSTINGVTFRACRTADIRMKGANTLYQDDPAGYVSPMGISGNNSINACTLNSNEFMAIEAISTDFAHSFSISGCSSTEGQLTNNRGIEIRNAFNFNINGNSLRCGPIYLEDCNRLSVRNNVLSEPRKYAIQLEACSDFLVKNNEGRNTVSALGGRHLISYANCTDGVISGNDSINLFTSGVNLEDGGGNTDVTATAGDDI